MTACVNKKHTRRVALAISASLVGALSLGAAAPAVAFAEDGISTQAVPGVDAFEEGKVTAAEDIDGKDIDIPATGTIQFTADGHPKGVYPTEVTTVVGQVTSKVDIVEGDYSVEYYVANADGVSTGNKTFAGDADPSNDGDAPYSVGKYVARLVMNGSSDYPGAVLNIPFEIKAATLEGLTAYDTVDGSFEFDGLDQMATIGYKMGDKILDKSMFTVKDITVAYDKGESVTDMPGKAVWAGDYSVVLVGNDGTPYAGSETEVKFTVTPLDLKNAAIVVADDDIDVMKAAGNAYQPTIVSINGDELATNPNLKARVEAVFEEGPDGSNLIKDRGVYSYTVKGIEGTGQVVNEQEITFTAFDTVLQWNINSALSNFFYQNSTSFPASINKAKGESFTPDKIHVEYNGEKLSADEVSYSVTNLVTGVTSGDLNLVNTPGTWQVTVRVDGSKNDYTLGGSHTFTVKTINGEVNAGANIYFVYDGKVSGNSTAAEYDGTDKLDKLQIVVTDTYGNVLTEGDDYDVVVTDKAGNKLDEVVDAGDYTVTVSSSSYNIDTTTDSFSLKVTPVVIKDLRVASTSFLHVGKKHIIPYTGQAIAPVIEYKASDGTWKTLPSETYTLTYTSSGDEKHGTYKKVDEMLETGYYKVYLHAVKNVANYDMATNSTDGFIQVMNQYDSAPCFKVSDQKVFADVENTFWGAQEIADAVDLGYMSGYKGTTFFGPLDHLTRAQAAVVLYNMGTGRSVPETSTLHVSWVERGLAFPDAEQWYAAELGWATQVGVVEGYPDGNYGGSDEITREQFAIMLRNYAAAKGEDVSVDDVDAALEGVKDADTISDWAREAVAWAVENGVMGAEGYVYAGDPIERAGAAIMVTRYQPQELDKDDYLVGEVK
ncbi:S-layer homology domain-containing protein [Collinsella sp. An2]|uniref:S-layer homology domain-containing protein n=1 Tax=Collinsella sp. An2 TaxID=1965585 RepID=UPI000B582C82|nr:S-layer homology domain-containing protein [Collinsella sp. An2]OUP06194.1 hypothetical protein B5F33_10395 [Collinsella sp. An2]